MCYDDISSTIHGNVAKMYENAREILETSFIEI
jgi:hypothetical protein